MREIRSFGSVGERGGNEPLYPEVRSQIAPSEARERRKREVER